MGPRLWRRSAVAALSVASLVAAQPAGQTFTGMGSTFDLTALPRSAVEGPYILKDERAQVVYQFNFFSLTPTPNIDTCVTLYNRTENLQPGFAWQLETPLVGAPQCYRLGGQTVGPQAWNYSIMDTTYPNRGVSMTYPGGESKYCPAAYPRSLTIELTCDPTVGAPPPIREDVLVQERNDCQYFVTLRTIAGCPTQCSTGGGLCNGHGVCGYNEDATRSQCYCYSGYGGDKCAIKASGLGVESILLIIVCIVLAGVLGLIGFMFLKLRRLQVDPAAYDDLQGRFNELGQLA